VIGTAGSSIGASLIAGGGITGNAGAGASAQAHRCSQQGHRIVAFEGDERRGLLQPLAQHRLHPLAQRTHAHWHVPEERNGGNVLAQYGSPFREFRLAGGRREHE
jgi:hypothetical protein